MELIYDNMFNGVDISTYENCKKGDIILFNGCNYTVFQRNKNNDYHINVWDKVIKNNKSYSIHNLIWCYYNNKTSIPEGKRIIFLNHDKSDVRLNNLRLVSDLMTEEEFYDVNLKYKYFDEKQVNNCNLGDRIFVYDRTYNVVDVSNGRCINSKGIILIYNSKGKRKYTRLSISSLLDSYYEYIFYKEIKGKYNG